MDGMNGFVEVPVLLNGALYSKSEAPKFERLNFKFERGDLHSALKFMLARTNFSSI
jgi:hypothetical protein